MKFREGDNNERRNDAFVVIGTVLRVALLAIDALQLGRIAFVAAV